MVEALRADASRALLQAFKFARRQPGFCSVVVATLAVGIGAATAAMNVAASVLLNPLPVRDAARLVLITKSLPTGSTLVPFSYAEIAAWREASRTLEAVAGVQYDGAWPVPAQLGERAITVTSTAVSGNFFDVLGVRPAVGRLLREQDAVAGAEPVAVIAYGFWRREFGGDNAVVGRTLLLNGRPATIAGVAPHGFAFPDDADVWRPLDIAPDTLGEGWFNLVARVLASATATQVAEESGTLVRQLGPMAPKGSPRDVRSVTIPFKEAIVGDVRPVLALFVAAAALLLVAGCFNVANLLLIRGTAREREIALRAALGATRWRLLRQLMTESTSLAVVGGILGAVVAYYLQRALIVTAPAGLPRLDTVGFDARAISLAVGGSVIGAALAGLAPALWLVRRSAVGRLRSPSVTATTGTQMSRQVLVGLQLAVALLVTVSASLLVRSLLQLQQVDLGFSPARLTVLHVPLVGVEYRNPERRLQFFEELVSRLQSMPGIAGATPVLLRPFTGNDGWDATVTADGQSPEAASANPGLQLEAVLPNYFSTMGIPVRRGRTFTDADREGSQPVVIVSDTLARRLWAESTVLGKRVKFGAANSPAPWMSVVGIVGDLRYRDLVAPPPAIYVPLRQTSFPPRFLILRAAGDAPVRSLAQSSVREMNPAEHVLEASPITELLGRELAAPRFHAFALGSFALVAVMLAALGVFGVLAASVAQRSRELAVRVALGADRADLRRHVLWRLMWPAALGLALGTGAAIATTDFLKTLLFEVSPLDVRAFVAGWVTLAGSTLIACLLPLRRAVRIDPVSVLRSE